jgi:hypothetical protein
MTNTPMSSLSNAIIAAVLIASAAAVVAPRTDASASDGGVNFNFIPSLFTATSQEYNSGRASALTQFELGVTSKDVLACMKAEGFPASSVPASKSPPVLPDNKQFPNIKRLESGSFGGGAGPKETGPGAGLGSNQSQAVQSSLRSCQTNASAIFTGIEKILAPLDDVWSSDLGYDDDNLMASSAVTQAMNGWRVCVDVGGVHAQSLDDFFGYVDQLTVSTSSTNDPELRHFATLYGKCIAPVSKAMDSTRLQLRAQLLNKYAPEMDLIERQLTTLVQSLSRQYGIKYSVKTH